MPDFSRRSFLKNAALITGGIIAAPAIVPSSVFGQNAPSNRLNVALIGCGGQGRSDARNLLSIGQNIIALCDVDENMIALARKELGASAAAAKSYSDYRELLAKGKSLDAVIIATPDHWHAPISVAAMHSGKHVYCEKPLTRTIGEARQLGQLARSSKVITQMGNQGSANPTMRRSLDLLKAGALGQIREMHAYVHRNDSPCGIAHPEGQDPIPAGLNWDAWVGPSPLRPYKQNIYHPYKWHAWYDFGTGQIGNFACHTLNLPVRALNLGYPSKIEIIDAQGLGFESYISQGTIKFFFPARPGLNPTTITWYDGGTQPPTDVFQSIASLYPDELRTGLMILGEKGEMYTDLWNGTAMIKLKGEPRLRDVFHHEATRHIPSITPKSPGHMLEWINAIKGGPVPFSNFQTGSLLTEITLTGVLALRLGQSIDYDGEKMEVPNLPQAQKFIYPTYRQNWL